MIWPLGRGGTGAEILMMGRKYMRCFKGREQQMLECHSFQEEQRGLCGRNGVMREGEGFGSFYIAGEARGSAEGGRNTTTEQEKEAGLWTWTVMCAWVHRAKTGVPL